MPHADRALLLSPSYDTNEYLYAESLGLRSVAATLRNLSVTTRIIDACALPVPDDVGTYAANCGLIGVGALFTRQIPDALQIIRELRSFAPEAHIVIGGQGVQFLWSRALEDCPSLDSVCMYEGDLTVAALVHRLRSRATVAGIPGLVTRENGRPRVGSIMPPVTDLDSLPFPSREEGQDSYSDGHATMCTSRGCMAHCSFCQSGNYGNRYHRSPRWRARSARSVINEISTLVDNHGVNAISFVDDDFLGGDGRGRDRALEFADLLEEQPFNVSFSIECRVNELDEDLMIRLRAVGLRHVLIGVEAANEHDLALFAKKTTTVEAEAGIALLRRVGLDFSMGFIMFHPLSDLDGIRTNLEFLSRVRVGSHRRVSNRLELYPGAPLISYFKRRGVNFREERYRLYYDFLSRETAQAYRAFKRALSPFIEAEDACNRAQFQVAKSPSPDSVLTDRLRDLEERISSALVRHAMNCVKEISHGRDPLRDRSIGSEVARDASDLAAQAHRLTT